MNPHPAAVPCRLAVIALASSLTACSTVGGWFSSDKADYKNTAAKQQPLDVPPDLTQLARDSRYQPQGGVVTASAAGAPVAPGAAPPATIALGRDGGMHIERDGQQRWLVSPLTPEQLWPRIKAFWEQRGFTLAQEDPQVGVMETNWAENRANQPRDLIRDTVGKLLPNLFDTGERDRYRTRIERTPGGSEIYIAHMGAAEVYTSERHDTTAWTGRPNDPQLEAEMLSRLMLTLGSGGASAQVAAAPASAAALATPAPGSRPAKAAATPVLTSLVVDEPFDRAWRRVGLALDRSGFTVEDRDRSAGLYFVRYVDPRNAGKEEPGFWARLFGDKSNPQEALRYRIAVKAGGERTTVSVQNSAGAADSGENAQRIFGLLSAELR